MAKWMRLAQTLIAVVVMGIVSSALAAEDFPTKTIDEIKTQVLV